MSCIVWEQLNPIFHVPLSPSASFALRGKKARLDSPEIKLTRTPEEAKNFPISISLSFDHSSISECEA